MLALRRAAYIRPQVRCLATTPTTQKRWGPPAPPTTTNLPRGCLVGAVVSTAMAKTINVDVTRTKIVPKYRKARRYSRRFLAHDEAEECALGDVVRIAPCRPLSRRKHFVVQEILKRANQMLRPTRAWPRPTSTRSRPTRGARPTRALG